MAKLERERERAGEQHAARPSSESQHPDEEQRPQQVELLFDREGPEVPEGGRCGELVEVALIGSTKRQFAT